MSFSATSRNIVLEGAILRAECRDRKGVWRHSEFHLNAVLGNIDGAFQWLKRDFRYTAKDVCLKGSILHARLKPCSGNYRPASVDLDERVSNLDGELLYHEGLGIYSRRGQSESAEGVFVFKTELLESPPMDEKERQKRDTEFVIEAEAKRSATEALFESQETYQYSPLTTPRSIRLVKVAPRNDQRDLIHCSLHEVDLDNAPPFAALSYTWGNPFPSTIPEISKHYQQSTSISCDGKRMKIGQNLYEALHRLHDSKCDEPRTKGLKTKLIEKAENGLIMDVERLLRQGADVHARDCHGETALHYAAENGHILVVKALVYAGSDIGAVDNKNRTPLDCTRQRRRRFWALVEKFLMQQQAQTAAIDRGNSCLRAEVAPVEYYWIDALSIDQSNDYEKSIQVAMMGEIYKNAKTVVVWLGPTYNDWQDPTLRLLKGIWTLEGARTGGRIQDEVLERMLHLFDKPNPYDVPADNSDRVTAAVEDWINTLDGNALFDAWLLGLPLFRRNWFSRAWVLQEVIMARHITVVCGRFIIPWDVLVFMSSFIQGLRSSLRFKRPAQRRVIGTLLVTGRDHRISPIDLEKHKRLFRNKGKLPMLDALFLTRNVSTSDPRDKVFSALSFSSMPRSTSEFLKQISPDYTQTTTELFTNVAKALFEAHGPCVLSLAGMRVDVGCPGLPSWVPDLQVSLPAKPRGLHVSNIIGPETKTLSNNINFQHGSFRITPENELQILGLEVDIITELALPGLNDVGSDLEVLQSWIDLISHLNLPHGKKYQVLSRTLIEDESATVEDTPEKDGNDKTQFRDWLVFLCYTALLELRTYLHKCAADISIPDNKTISIQCVKALDARPLPALFTKAKSLFTSLDMNFELNSVLPTFLHKMNSKDDKGPKSEWIASNADRWQIWEYLAPHAEAFGNVMRSKDVSRRLVHLERTNAIGTVPNTAQVGDVVCVVDGARVPYVMRKGPDGKYQLVGEAFVYGLEASKVLNKWNLGMAQRMCIV